jgi:NAD+ diphosphatase
MLDDLLLSRSVVDRAAHLRADSQWHAVRLRDPATLVLWAGRDAAAMSGDEGLLLVPATAVDPALAPELSFLGIDADGRAYYAAHADDIPAGGELRTLREVGHLLTDVEAGLMVAAVALHNWRMRTRFCSDCGGPLEIAQAGWSMRCPADGHEEFPRTDPAVIVLVRDRDDRAMLGRQVRWDAGRFSTFAGFVDAGESAEAAVRREVFEETGIRIGPDPDDLCYLGSQPWPFPRSLMLGYHAWTDHTEIRVDETEIAEAYWFTREELREAIDAGHVQLPPAVSVSRRLIERWYGAELPGGWTR